MEDEVFVKSAGSVAVTASTAAAAARAAQPPPLSRPAALERDTTEPGSRNQGRGGGIMPIHTLMENNRQWLPGGEAVQQGIHGEPRKVHVAAGSEVPNTVGQQGPLPAQQESWESSPFVGFPAPPMPYSMFSPPAMGAYMPGMYPVPWTYPPVQGVPGMLPGGFPGPVFGGMHGVLPPMGQLYPAGGGLTAQAGLAQTAPGAAARGKSANAAKGKSRERRRRGKQKSGRDRASSPASASDDGNAARSDALVEVRKHGGKCKLTLSEVMPHLLEFARDQHGSRFLQTVLDTATDQEKQTAFSGLLPEAVSLARDAFGNFVIQKFFEIGNAEQKRALAAKLQPEVLALSNEAYGCRVIQTAIQHVSRESQLMLAEELKQNVTGCIDSMHGNHVIQKCIEQMPPDSVNFIIRALEDQTERMASHMYGCRVIQRLLEHCAASQLQRLLEQILSSVEALAQDNFGNYVVQHMLVHGRVEDKKRIIDVIQHRVIDFAKNKCSSNVVERCFEIAAVGEHAAQLEEERAKLMKAVLGERADPNPPLHQLMDDKYGNYIVQRMIEHSRGVEREELRQQILAAEPKLRDSANGKHILVALQREWGHADLASRQGVS